MSDLFEQMAADSAAAALKSAPSDNDASRIREIGIELVTIEQRIERGTALLKELGARKDVIMRRELVDAMDAVGMDKLGLAEFNVDIVTGEFVHASLPNPEGEKDPEEYQRKADLRKGGLAWLEENEFGDLIKTMVIVELPRGALADARRIQEFVQNMPALDPETGRPVDNGPPIGYSASIEETVHWATLTSFVKEQLKRPEVVLPLEKLGAIVGRIAKIVKRKKV